MREDSGSRLTAGLIVAASLAVLAAFLYPLLRTSAPPGYTAQAAVVTLAPAPSQPLDIPHLGMIREHSQQAVLTAYVTQQRQDLNQQAVLDAQAIAAQAAQYVPPPPPKPAAPVVSSAPVTVSASGFEACVISRESGGDPTAYNSSSGASGLFGMLLSTWDSLGLGYPGGAYTAPVSVQEQGFAILYARDGTAPWGPYDGC
jgi:hypothetical protein